MTIRSRLMRYKESRPVPMTDLLQGLVPHEAGTRTPFHAAKLGIFFKTAPIPPVF